jgi:hypothetical protein
MSRTNYTDPDEVGNRILHEMYGLTPAQVVVYNQLHGLVDEALEQFEQGYAVDVEAELAELARKFAPTAKLTPD